MLQGNVKNFFFDRAAVTSAIDRAAASRLSRFGGMVRVIDRRSMRYRKTVSAPGSPPSARRQDSFKRTKTSKKTGITTKQASSPLRELTFYAYDPARRSVVIGPAVFTGSKVGGGIAPDLLEEGGTGPVVSDGQVKVGHYRPRPHTGPAFRATLPKAAAMFRGSIGR